MTTKTKKTRNSLTDEQIILIWEFKDLNYTQIQIADEVGTSRYYVRKTLKSNRPTEVLNYPDIAIDDDSLESEVLEEINQLAISQSVPKNNEDNMTYQEKIQYNNDLILALEKENKEIDELTWDEEKDDEIYSEDEN